MNAVQVPTIDELEERLRNGVQYLFELERRGETNGEYARWLDRWVAMLQQYEELQAA